MAGDKPLGLPTGSVRAIIVLLLVVAVVLISLAVTLRVLFGPGDDFSPREAFLLVFAAVTSLTNLGVGYYFGSKPSAGSPEV
jgi:hypothetical protein